MVLQVHALLHQSLTRLAELSEIFFLLQTQQDLILSRLTNFLNEPIDSGQVFVREKLPHSLDYLISRGSVIGVLT